MARVTTKHLQIRNK